MKSIALAVLVTTLGACASHEAEQRATAQPLAAQQAAERQAKVAAESKAAEAKAAEAKAAESKAAATAHAADTAPAPAPASPEHAWLHQLVGEWTFSCQSTMDDGGMPFKMEGTESVRSIGGLWIVAEGRGTMAGQSMQSVMSLGYKPEAKAYIGTWLDSMQPHMWSYTGSLDAGKTTLTLDTEGPSFEDPAKMSRYRDTIELKDKDHKVLTSSVQGADGNWTTFMRAEYSRKK